ncbi:TcpQ domain-containing protein [Pusillimonas sp. CC-YST705]|uniref:TcpQ domain-containing protein n=1 Tax=Mesopusillimonas faecipullorum TaxID=2755040 RepID=A0ABS8CA91_9BURK|nr:TcpQ domain-containing protein [Mesopusillimonas faecipullorum]MCB5362908.1 TcpQ domain-containing protein [Mesopusillimonas faecipullorum]
MMKKVASTLGIMALMLLAGCGSWYPTAIGLGPAQRPTPAGTAYFDFSWELSGDRQAAPLQVFDDGHRMWMQFSPYQGEPALWQPAPEGKMLALAYQRQGPYLVIEPVQNTVLVQAQGRQAKVQRQMAAEPPSEAPQTTASQASPAALAPDQHPAVTLSPVEQDVSPLIAFSVERGDGHMRRTLTRWAEQAGWVFQGEHWSVDVDIPVSGDAVFELPFEQAVQALLAATELSDRPLQPCFYSNKVVRVVAFAQACDRTASPGEHV